MASPAAPLHDIHQAFHDDGLYCDNNALAYFKLEEVTRGTSYVNSIKPFQRNKDERGSFLSLLHQYCGKDKWDSEQNKVNLTSQALKWRGQSNYPLERFCQKHRNGFMTM